MQDTKKIIPPIHETLTAKKDQVCYDPEFKDEDLAELWGMYSDCYKSKIGCRPIGAYHAAKTVENIWQELHDGSLDYVPGEDD